MRFASGTPQACLVNGQSLDYGPYVTRMDFVAADGTQTILRDVKYDGQPQGANVTNCNAVAGYTPVDRGKIFASSDGSDLVFVADQDVYDDKSSAFDGLLHQSGVLYFKDGTKYRLSGTGDVTQIEDRNGNLVQLTYDDNTGDITIVDPLNRTITVSIAAGTGPNGATYDAITYPGTNGAARTVKVYSNTLSTALAPGQGIESTGQMFAPLGSGIDNWVFNPPVTTSIVLPDGQSAYTFQYNSYG
jgi:hypothetical protein